MNIPPRTYPIARSSRFTGDFEARGVVVEGGAACVDDGVDLAVVAMALTGSTSGTAVHEFVEVATVLVGEEAVPCAG